MKNSVGILLLLSSSLLLSGCSAVLDKPGMYLLERTAPRPTFEPYQPSGKEEAMMARARALYAAGRQDEVDNIYHELAQAGYPKALWTLARWPTNGKAISRDNCDRDNRKTHWAVEKLADQGDLDAITFYWECVNQGSDYLHDTGKGLYYLEHLAEKDNLMALSKLFLYRMSWYRGNEGTEPHLWSVRRRAEMHRTPDMEAAGKWLTQYAQVISNMDKRHVRHWDYETMGRHFLAMANTYMKLGEYASALKWYRAHKAILDDFNEHPDLPANYMQGLTDNMLWFVNKQIKVAESLAGDAA